jgi:hypothetical protein
MKIIEFPSRLAACLDDQYELVVGALSSTAERSVKSPRDCKIAPLVIISLPNPAQRVRRRWK